MRTLFLVTVLFLCVSQAPAQPDNFVDQVVSKTRIRDIQSGQTVHVCGELNNLMSANQFYVKLVGIPVPNRPIGWVSKTDKLAIEKLVKVVMDEVSSLQLELFKPGADGKVMIPWWYEIADFHIAKVSAPYTVLEGGNDNCMIVRKD